MNAFLGFTSAAIYITTNHLEQMEDKYVGNIMSKASPDIIKSWKLNENNELHK